jgi:hypothetical protein
MHLEDLGLNEKIPLKRVFKEWGYTVWNRETIYL